MKKSRVKGLNGAWAFGFSVLVKHGLGEREVEALVPVGQVLELADQFRACAGGPGHAVWHLQHPHRAAVCERDQEARDGGLHYCPGCRSTSRGVDTTDNKCPTCGRDRAEAMSGSPYGDLSVARMTDEVMRYIRERGAAGDPHARPAREVLDGMLADLDSEHEDDREAVREVFSLIELAYQAGRASAKQAESV